MTNPCATAAREGREARKAGKPRVSPYINIPLLRAFHQPWLNGWDAMDEVLRDNPPCYADGNREPLTKKG
jgi:hypothetical protein